MEEDFDLDALLAAVPDLLTHDVEGRRVDTAFEAAMRSYETSLPRGYLSQSQIGLFLKCGRAYEFRYVLGAQSRGNSKMAQGTAVHAAADVLHKSMILQEPIPVEAVKDAYADAHEKAFDPNKDLELAEEDQDLGVVKDRGIGLVALYHSAALGHHVQPVGKKETPGPALRPLFVTASERAVKSTLVARNAAGEPLHDPVPFLAIMDIEEPHSTRDLKVRGKMPNSGEAVNSIQLALYSQVRLDELVEANTITPEKAASALYDVSIDALVKPGKTTPERYLRLETQTTPESRAHAVTIATEVADDIRAGRFRRTLPDAWWCSEGWCSYWGLCRGAKK